MASLTRIAGSRPESVIHFVAWRIRRQESFGRKVSRRKRIALLCRSLPNPGFLLSKVLFRMKLCVVLIVLSVAVPSHPLSCLMCTPERLSSCETLSCESNQVAEMRTCGCCKECVAVRGKLTSDSTMRKLRTAEIECQQGY